MELHVNTIATMETNPLEVQIDIILNDLVNLRELREKHKEDIKLLDGVVDLEPKKRDLIKTYLQGANEIIYSQIEKLEKVQKFVSKINKD